MPPHGSALSAGLLIIGLFVLVEMRTESPLIKVSIFRVQAFTIENIVLLIAMMAFIPIFFFASEYAQIALNKSAIGGWHLSPLLLHWLRHRRADRRADSRPRGSQAGGGPRVCHRRCGLRLLGLEGGTLSFGKQQIWVIVAGAGMGMMLGPANTDAINRAGNLSYGEATGITQTIRNYGASLGLAALGTTLLINFRSHLTSSLQKMHVANAAAVANQISESHGSGSVSSIPHYVSVDFASATGTVLDVMCGIMALAALVALVGLKRGRQELPPDAAPADPAAPSATVAA